VLKKVLFLSSANGARSQMAEAFLRALAADRFEAHSAGSEPHGVHTMAVVVMAERGIDITEQQAKGLREYMNTAEFDYLITVCDQAEKACPMFPGKGAREYWPLEDAARVEGGQADPLAAYRDVRDQIETRVRRWLIERRYKPVPPRSLQGAGVDR
jgi:arsenate reductase (thioredoxin)